MAGIWASVSNSIWVMAKASPVLSRCTFAAVWMRLGVRPARESWSVIAMVKHPAWAAPISSSGLVADWPSSKRDLKEYGPSKAPLPTFSRPLPWARLPVHSASALWVGIKSPFDWLLMLYWILRRVRRLRRVSVLTHIGTARHNQLDGKHLNGLAELVSGLATDGGQAAVWTRVRWSQFEDFALDTEDSARPRRLWPGDF